MTIRLTTNSTTVFDASSSHKRAASVDFPLDRIGGRTRGTENHQVPIDFFGVKETQTNR